MNVHKNSRLAPLGRAVMIRRIEKEGWPVARAAAAVGCPGAPRIACSRAGELKASRSVFAPACLPSCFARRDDRAARTAAPPSPDRSGDHAHAGTGALHGGRGAAPYRTGPLERTRAQGAGQPL